MGIALDRRFKLARVASEQTGVCESIGRAPDEFISSGVLLSVRRPAWAKRRMHLRERTASALTFANVRSPALDTLRESNQNLPQLCLAERGHRYRACTPAQGDGL